MVNDSFDITTTVYNGCKALHYENIPMRYTVIFKIVNNENFQYNFFYIFLIFAKNIAEAVLTSTHHLCLEQKQEK